MALNRLMHPRNIYRVPPNFRQLAIDFPEFRKYATQDLTGKVHIDFKDRETLFALTKVLLQRDFRLEVDMPPDRLVPTIPLRLNYILWIEDLIGYKENVHGIDIGTGASCIYPLLAARKNKWKMLATEVDDTSISYANRNISVNSLDDLITVKSVPEDRMLINVLDPEITYDFCMCNPPFFSTEDELESINKSRSPSRNPPRNAQSGSAHELVTEGGEIAFAVRIISDSFKLQCKVRIYTVMLGHKSSIPALLRVLKDLQGTSDCRTLSTTTTQFCQGRTMRWGLAWSFDPSINLDEKPLKAPKTKNKQPIAIILNGFTFKSAVKGLRLLFNDLQMTMSVVKETDKVFAMQVTAMFNTWIHQRKKRRIVKLQENNNEKGDEPKFPFIYVQDKQLYDKIVENNCNKIETSCSQAEKSNIPPSVDQSNNKIEMKTSNDELAKSNGGTTAVQSSDDSEVKTSNGELGKSNVEGSALQCKHNSEIETSKIVKSNDGSTKSETKACNNESAKSVEKTTATQSKNNSETEIREVELLKSNDIMSVDQHNDKTETKIIKDESAISTKEITDVQTNNLNERTTANNSLVNSNGLSVNQCNDTVIKSDDDKLVKMNKETSVVSNSNDSTTSSNEIVEPAETCSKRPSTVDCTEDESEAKKGKVENCNITVKNTGDEVCQKRSLPPDATNVHESAPKKLRAGNVSKALVTNEEGSSNSLSTEKVLDSLKPLIVIDVIIRYIKIQDSGDTGDGMKCVVLELAWAGGTGGWDIIHQIKQYLKNHLKPC